MTLLHPDLRRRILILMSHTGGGHRSVSLALEQALIDIAGPAVEAGIVDAFALGRPALLDRATYLYGSVIRYAPWFYGWLYHLTDNPPVHETVLRQAEDALVPRLRRQIVVDQPAAIVATHPLCLWTVLRALEDTGLQIPVLATVTELVSVHRSWVEPGVTHWTTATPEAREAVIEHGAPAERVSCLGLPINAGFGRVTTAPAAIRRRLGLDPHRLTLLVVNGGEGTGSMERLVSAIAAAGVDAQMIVVCGRNQRVRERLAAARLPVPAAVLGFVDDMPELMHAADIVLTKGGPTSIVEAIASGRPMIITQTLPGQEEGNAEYVEQHGIGRDGRQLDQAIAAIRHLAERPAERAAMAARARAMARLDAARDTAALLLGLADSHAAQRLPADEAETA